MTAIGGIFLSLSLLFSPSEAVDGCQSGRSTLDLLSRLRTTDWPGLSVSGLRSIAGVNLIEESRDHKTNEVRGWTHRGRLIDEMIECGEVYWVSGPIGLEEASIATIFSERAAADTFVNDAIRTIGVPLNATRLPPEIVIDGKPLPTWLDVVRRWDQANLRSDLSITGVQLRKSYQVRIRWQRRLRE